MARLNSEWKVGPHGRVQRLDTGLVTVAGEITMPLGRFPRRMTVIALKSGRTAVWSPVPLDEVQMKEIEKLGPPEFLIVPGVGHRLDIKAWKARYPKARVICPPGAAKAVAEAVKVDATTDVLGDAAVTFQAVPGTGEKEAALLVRRKAGTTLVVNDILANVHHPNGIGAQIMARLMGFGVRQPQVPWLGKRLFVDDQKALAAAFHSWAQVPDLKRIIVSHGDVISDGARKVLQRIASELGG